MFRNFGLKIKLSFAFLLPILFFQNCGQKTVSVADGQSFSSELEGGNPNTAPTPTPAPGSTPTPAPTPTPTPTPGPNQVYVLVATGHVGRTIMSCDQGRTWINDRSDNPATRCWVTGDPNYVECDHQANSGRNIDFGNGTFYASYGWGSNQATLRKSTDGRTWTTLATGSSGAGVSFYNGFLIWVNGGDWPGSSNGGTSFTNFNPNFPAYPNYAIRTVSRSEGLLVASGDDPGGIYSRDGGRTWAIASLSNVEWTRSVLVQRGNGQLITVSSKTVGMVSNLYSARSTDNGATWVGQTVATAPAYDNWSGLIFNGTQFVAWSPGKKWTSLDGINWTSVVVAPNLVEGPVAYTPNGTYVSIPNIWDRYYANQRAYYSMDGVNWTPATFPGSHPITKITGGYVDASVCP